MVPRRRGKIISFGSLLTFQGGLTVPAYAAAKGAIGQLTKALSNEWAQHNVQVNAICPGYIATDMCVGALLCMPHPAALTRAHTQE
jgi:2-deoxy-D-gluconate 3-dehydrogenase